MPRRYRCDLIRQELRFEELRFEELPCQSAAMALARETRLD
jgi:hypothetical protein